MRILITGASGFIGSHIVPEVLAQGHSVLAVGRTPWEHMANRPWIADVDYITCDIQHDFTPLLESSGSIDVLIHLAWSGLPNYHDFFHIDQNLPSDLAFLTTIIKKIHIPHVLIAGTCLEYGMQYGPLKEDMKTLPTTPYGLAKDMLRSSLELFQSHETFILQWVRLFYMYGEGQNSNSLLAQLDRAIDNRDSVFSMSMGDQLRDYLPITEVARRFAFLIDHPEVNGVINCCSGKPISVIDMVKEHCSRRQSSILLNRGYFPYPDYEPRAFWGVPSKLTQGGFISS